MHVSDITQGWQAAAVGDVSWIQAGAWKTWLNSPPSSAKRVDLLNVLQQLDLTV